LNFEKEKKLTFNEISFRMSPLDFMSKSVLIVKMRNLWLSGKKSKYRGVQLI
jgi:hypothetical protein